MNEDKGKNDFVFCLCGFLWSAFSHVGSSCSIFIQLTQNNNLERTRRIGSTSLQRRDQPSVVTGAARTFSASLPGAMVGDGELDDEESLDPATMPYFDYSVPRNISTIVGQHAFLLCRVYRMKDRSWSGLFYWFGSVLIRKKN
ncbi:hypothetical protein Ocin01_03572 [Orchesella cincta]|uniref:Uncharacterized protein n=1 Tax=Orchesella cincta TaxID=48709 RepID=A0A1D2NCW4_ORCCI|nr:hypothetical protein Ocin01_03572 [Orchesella cincta]